ncbi:MAG: AIR carboxylase family protein, partial [Clostridia bacterium]|nr:AIR carboxylase family protein [Clostridia bacterium]
LICAAGKAAHLAGAVAARTTLPVIGIPVKTSALEGLDALLSTVQMPSGVPVATVAIDGAANAALLAVQILAVTDAVLAEKLEAKRVADHAAILDSKLDI